MSVTYCHNERWKENYRLSKKKPRVIQRKRTKSHLLMINFLYRANKHWPKCQCVCSCVKKKFHSTKLWCTMTMRNCLFLLTWKCSRFGRRLLKAKLECLSLIGKEKVCSSMRKTFLVPKTFIFFCSPLFLLALTNHDCKKIFVERKRISGIYFLFVFLPTFKFFYAAYVSTHLYCGWGLGIMDEDEEQIGEAVWICWHFFKGLDCDCLLLNFNINLCQLYFITIRLVAIESVVMIIKLIELVVSREELLDDKLTGKGHIQMIDYEWDSNPCYLFSGFKFLIPSFLKFFEYLAKCFI